VAARGRPAFPALVLLITWAVMVVTGAPSRAETGEESRGKTNESVEPVIDFSTLPSTGRGEAILTVARFGRYAVTVESAEGIALQLIDRMAGPGEIYGKAGEQDGRIEAFLDQGTYKIVTFGPEKSQGDARLTVHPFEERNRPTPALVEFKSVEGRLEDLEQRSYGLEISQERNVSFEAAGRDLADLRLWRDGTWLVDADPVIEVITPRQGRSLTLCRLNAKLPTGRYLLTAYGGSPQIWGEESGEHPFYLRFGIPKLAEAGRRRMVVSKFGFDHWLVPSRTNFFRLELPESRPATLQCDDFDPDTPFADAEGPCAEITKTSSPPATELDLGPLRRPKGSAEAFRRITIRAEADQPYVLQEFRFAREYAFSGSGDYWISSIRTGAAADNGDATVILVPGANATPATPGAKELPVEPIAAGVVEISSAQPWVRHCNLLGTMTVFLHVREAGKYQVLAEGVLSHFRIEPFLVTRPPDYRAPDLQPVGKPWDLDVGYYTLTIEPETHGIIELGIQFVGLKESLMGLLGRDRHPRSPQPPRPSVCFPRVSLYEGRSYQAIQNLVPETKQGFVLRALPLDLTLALPIGQVPGDTVRVSFKTDEPVTLRAEAEDGTLLDVSVDRAPAAPSPRVRPGLHEASVVLTGESPVLYALLAEPVRLAPQTPLPVMPDTLLPEFPTLSAEAPVFVDLDRESAATYVVHAASPGLYRLESTGLLAMQGTLRGRTICSFDTQSGNGAGRNFLIQQYLREGDYQFTVTTTGLSKGHLGLTLAGNPVVEAGNLKPGGVGRLTLQGTQAAAYWIDIPSSGEYRLESVGLSGMLRCRLEDDDGWPLESPGGAASFQRRFEKGRYRLVLLPAATEMRAVTRFEEIVPPPHCEGHGPHALPFDVRFDHTWLEPASGEPRMPDVWKVSVEAPMKASITLSGEMQGVLRKELGKSGEERGKSGAGDEVAFLPPGRGWKGELEAGDYLLEAVCSRRNHRAPYAIEVNSAELVSGMSRLVTVPVTLDLSVGRDGLVELESSGRADVRAELYNADGDIVARDDDRPNDWNFHMALPLPAGRYRLKLDPVGERRAETTVRMLMPEERPEPGLLLPARRTLALGGPVHIFPLELPPQPTDFLLIAVRAGEAVACAVEGMAVDSWKILASATGLDVRLAVPLSAERRPLRLRVWSVDRQGRSVTLSASAIHARRYTESDLGSGITLAAASADTPPSSEGPESVDKPASADYPASADRPASRLTLPVAAAIVDLSSPGLFRIERPWRGIAWSAALDEGCAVLGEPVIAADREMLYLAGDSDVRVRGRRAALGPATPIQFTLSPTGQARCDLRVKTETPGTLVAVLATSSSGQPGVRIADTEDAASLEPTGGSMAVSPGSAFAVGFVSAGSVAIIWSADRPDRPMDVRLETFEFQAISGEALSLGSLRGALVGGESRTLTLPPGCKRVLLALSDSTAGVVSRGNAIESVHWAAGEPFEETLETDAPTLTLLHVGKAGGRYAVDLLPVAAGDTINVVRAGRPFERRCDSAGRLRVPVLLPTGTAASALHVRTAPSTSAGSAALESPTFIGRDGTVRRGTDLAALGSGVGFGAGIGGGIGDGMGAGIGGTLVLPHGPGYVLVYLDAPGAEARDLWPSTEGTQAQPVTPPAILSLHGTSQMLRIVTPVPQMIHLRSAGPSVSMVRVGANPPDVELHPEDVALDLYHPPGVMEVGLRALAGGALSGEAEVTASPILPITEGLGPETLLAPGASAVYSFDVRREGAVGVGARASSDLVDVRLLDTAGHTLGTGLAQMPTLVPGTYLLILRAPPSAGPVTVRPALAGVSPPGTGPPAEVIREYLAKTGPDASPSVRPEPR
jgi:hypothetical protein